MKDQVSYYKAKYKESESQAAEIIKLKQNIKNLENVRLALDGTTEQVNEMIRSEHNSESLAILAAMLKK